MQRSGKIKNVKKKIHFRARKVLWDEIGNFVWASSREQGEVCGSRKKFSGGEKGRTKLPRHAAWRSSKR